MSLYTTSEKKSTVSNERAPASSSSKPEKQALIDNYLNNYYRASLKRREMRKNIRKQQTRKFNYYAIFTVIFSIIIIKIFVDNSYLMFFNKLRNINIKAPTDISYLNQAEYIFSEGGDFFDTRLLDEINTNNPLMKTPVLTGKMNVLTARLKNLAAQYPALNAGIFVWDFGSGRYVDIKGDEIYPTASIIKLPIMYQLFRRAEKSLIDMNDKLGLTNYYMAEGSGSLQYSPEGRTLTYKRLVSLMIQESDNTATNMILSSIGGMNELNREMKQWGIKTTSMSNWLPDLQGTNVSTPKEMATILYNIGNEDMLSLKSQAEIINILSHVRNRNLIQAGLPDTASFFHKTGDIGTMLGDAGIVALPDNRKYIIVVMVKRPWNAFSAKEFIIEASKIVYNSYVTGIQ